MNRILVIDDHVVARIGINMLLVEALPVSDWGEAATVEEALRLAGQRSWDLAVLDLAVNHNRGLQLLKELRKKHPHIPVLVLTGLSEEEYANRVMKAGASGFVSKTADSAEFTNAARNVLHGGRHISPVVAAALAASPAAAKDSAFHKSLSDREYQVMKLLGAGKTVGEIAVFLSISDKTVSTYRARILDKTKLRNNAEIVRYVVENGLLE